MKNYTPKQIIEITDGHDDEQNSEGMRQENCDICMNMEEQDVIWFNKFLRNKYDPESIKIVKADEQYNQSQRDEQLNGGQK